MNLLPCPAKFFQAFRQHRCDAGDLPSGESIILTKLYRACRTVQIENSLAPMPDYVNMSRAVIVWIHHTRRPANRTTVGINLYSNIPKSLGYFFFFSIN